MKTFLFLLALLTSQSLARVGETLQEIETRYGDNGKVVTPMAPATMAKSYRFQGLIVNVNFLNGRAVSEAYANKLEPLKIDQLASILNANAGNVKWSDLGSCPIGNMIVDDNKRLIGIVSFDKYTLIVADGDFFYKMFTILNGGQKPNQPSGF